MTTYRHFACPVCLRLTTAPWSQAWCANDPAYSLQAYDPNAEDGMAWTKMVELSPDAIQAAIMYTNPKI